LATPVIAVTVYLCCYLWVLVLMNVIFSFWSQQELKLGQPI